MKRNFRHYAILAAGWIFILLGILGLFLPILQGVLFLCIGLILLSGRSPRVRLMIMKAGARWPKFRYALDASKAKAKQWRAKLSGQSAR